MDKKIYVKDGLRKIVQGEQLIISVGVDHNSFTNDGSDHNLHYLWTKDGTPFGNEEGDLSYHDYDRSREFWDRPILVLDDIQVEDSGIYQCEISNAFGTVQSDATTVEVLDALNTPLLARNLVQNGEMRDGDAGWNIIEGSMEQIEPYFWDRYKGIGFASKWNMTPSSGDIINEVDYPGPADGDRLLAQWANRSNENEIKIQQEIDLTPISDVIDRNIEGITSVDLRVGAWLSSKRFHPHYSQAYTKFKDDGGIHYGRATTNDASNEDKSWPMNAFFYKRIVFTDDRLHIDFLLFNDKNDLIKRVRLHNVPTSYMSSLSAFKHRRIDLPVGTRRMRIELIGRRDNSRPHDKKIRDTKSDIVKMIAVGTWGLNARIYVNDIGDTFNTTYEHWRMPDRDNINPAVLSYEAEYHIPFKNRIKDFWNEINQEGVKSDITYTLSSWMGYPLTSYKWGANRNGEIRMPWKFFDIWRTVPNDLELNDDEWQNTDNYDEHLEGFDRVSETWHDGHEADVPEWWFGQPCSITDAAKSHLNMKKMNVHWLKDYHLNRMDQGGKSYMIFQYTTPVLERDQESLESVVSKRRKLVVPAAGVAPLVQQKVYFEDIDRIIYDVHANTSQFKPFLNQLETKYGAWNYSGYWYLSDEIYDFAKEIHTSGLNGVEINGTSPTWEEFISRPRANGHLSDYYYALKYYVWFLLNIPIAESIQTDSGVIINMRNYLEDKLNIEEIWDQLKIYLGIPDEQLIHREDELRIWVRKRAADHLLDTFFRTVLKRLMSGYKDDFYKDAIDGSYKTTTKIKPSADNLWTDGDP